MATGIRAEVTIDARTACPVTAASATTGGACYSVSRSRSADGCSVEEFMLDTTAPIADAGVDVDFTPVFTYGDKRVYRFERDAGESCPCDTVESLSCPVADVYTESGTLHLAFHAMDMDQLQDVVGRLRDAYDGVSIKRLLRSAGDVDQHNLVFVDRQDLTDRQREVLETAHEMGYFEHPKGANAGEVADELGITTSTFTEHLAAAQRKLLGAILAG